MGIGTCGCSFATMACALFFWSWRKTGENSESSANDGWTDTITSLDKYAMRATVHKRASQRGELCNCGGGIGEDWGRTRRSGEALLKDTAQSRGQHRGVRTGLASSRDGAHGCRLNDAMVWQWEQALGEEVGQLSACKLGMHRQRQHFFVRVITTMKLRFTAEGQRPIASFLARPARTPRPVAGSNLVMASCFFTACRP
jgi:hypothetical protein